MKIHSKLNNNFFKYITILAAVTTIIGFGIHTAIHNNANAISAKDFNAGNIISDYVFYNKDSMSANQIQDFLNNIVGSCDTWGSQKAVDWGRGDITRAQFAKQSWNINPPFVCLNNYHENPQTGETSYEKGGGWFDGGISASHIIYEAAQKYGINPQVLLVMLKKESSGPLTSDKWPIKNQYKYAMGYACPDSGPNNSANCTATKAGFYKQINLAAWQLKYYREHPNDYRYSLGWNDIQYSPDPACGTKRVYIENIATLSLYIYTPYTPNDGALANCPGTAPCGAYGNRNFFMFFSQWFGSTHSSGFRSLDIPRWMEISSDNVQKIDVYNDKPQGDVLARGRQLKFVDKILINNTWYLRTEFDRNVGAFQGIPQSQVRDIPYSPITPKWLTATTDGNKSTPSTRTGAGSLSKGTSAKIVDQIVVDGNLYYRTEYDRNHGNNVGIHSKFLGDFQAISLESPRNFCPVNIHSIEKINPQTGQTTETVTGKSFNITKKVLVNGIWYYQIKQDENSLKFIDSRTVADACYVPFETPRKMSLNKNSSKVNPYNSKILGSFTKGTVMSLSEKIFINNRWYYRTSHDTDLGISSAITASSFSEVVKN